MATSIPKFVKAEVFYISCITYSLSDMRDTRYRLYVLHKVKNIVPSVIGSLVVTYGSLDSN